MEKYRKDNQFYLDRYDRFTIEILKELEKEITNIDKSPFDKSRIKYHDRGALLAQSKKGTIETWKREDEQKDSIIARHSPPPKRDCQECNVRMHFEDYIFLGNNYEVIFAYNCPKNKEHRKLYFNSGVEYIPKKRKCQVCGGQLTTKKKRNKSALVITDKCNDCGNTIKDEFDLSPEEPINETERKKYCTDFIKSRTFMQDLAEIDNLKFVQFHPFEKEEAEEFDVSKIEKVKVLKLEDRLKKIVEKNGFLKFQFEKTKIDKFVIVEFSAQDNSDREKDDCIKAIKKILKTELFMTNWRLIDSEINYGLGLITGKLKGAEDDESILKIAKEVKSKLNKK